MPSVSTIIQNALTMTGEKPIGATLTTAESNYHLSRLNSMIDSWSNERLMIHTLSQTSFPLTVSTGSYSIGSGATFNMTRPTRLVDPCWVRDSQSYDSPLTIISMESYGKIGLKSSGNSYPVYIAYDAGYSATSTATVYFYPLPISALSTFINTLQPLTNFSTVSQTLQLPPGYQDAIETNYAIRSAFGVTEVSPMLREAAVKTKAAIKTTNSPEKVMRLDYGVSKPRYNIITGP